MIEFNVKDCVVHVDPNNAYPHMDNKDIMGACGYLIDWLIEGALDYAADLGENLRQKYQYSMGWHDMHEGSEVKKNQFLFPGDPPQDALVKVSQPGESVYIFPHSIVVWEREGSNTVMERMD